jgi:hypothetical protein
MTTPSAFFTICRTTRIGSTECVCLIAEASVYANHVGLSTHSLTNFVRSPPFRPCFLPCDTQSARLAFVLPGFVGPSPVGAANKAGKALKQLLNKLNT